MNTLAARFQNLLDCRPNKEGWESFFDERQITGYGSGSLLNDVGSLYSPDNTLYADAIECLAWAIKDMLYLDEVKKTAAYRTRKSFGFPDNMVNLPAHNNLRIVNSFDTLRNYEAVMEVLELARCYGILYYGQYKESSE